MGSAAADVYRTNAANAELDKKPARTTYSAAYIREVRLTLGKDAAARLLNGEQATRQLSLPAPAMVWPDGIPTKLQRQLYAVCISGLERIAREERERSDPNLFGSIN